MIFDKNKDTSGDKPKPPQLPKILTKLNYFQTSKFGEIPMIKVPTLITPSLFAANLTPVIKPTNSNDNLIKKPQAIFDDFEEQLEAMTLLSQRSSNSDYNSGKILYVLWYFSILLLKSFILFLLVVRI